MFGFLHGSRRDRSYRQLYAAHCSSNRDWLGLRSLAFLSYEAIFASAIATDLGLIEPPPVESPTCCRTSRGFSAFRHETSAANRFAARFCGAFAMLLAEVKLEDDIRDGGSWAARFAKWSLRRQTALSSAFFAERAPDFRARLEASLAEHAALERNGANHSIETYSRPTGEAFAMVFSLLPIGIAGAEHKPVDDATVELFEIAGRHVGRALIAFDCAVDYELDRKRGHFNPLHGRGDVRRAFDFSQRELIQLGWRLAEFNGVAGDELIACRALRHRIATMSDRSRSGLKSASPALASRMILRRARAGFCDCDCPGCDCPGCDCSDAGVGCCTPIELCPCDCGNQQSQRKTSSDPSSATNLRGRTAEVVVELMPFGTIRLEGEPHEDREYPAKSDRGPIPAGTRVRVVRKKAFGLVVRPLDIEASETLGHDGIATD